MAEILLLLWFALICVLIAGFILGFGLGKALTIKHYHLSVEQLVDEVTHEHNNLPD